MQPIPAPGANNSAQLADMAQKIADTDAQLKAAAKTANDAAAAATAAKARADAAMSQANAAGTAAGTASTTAGDATNAAGAAKSMADAAKAAADAAAARTIPGAATAAPPVVDLDGSMGTSTRYAREDHTHPINVQRAVVTADANGQASLTFARPFTTEPAINALIQGGGTATDNSRRTVSVEYTLVTTGTGTAKRWTGVTLNVTASRPLPIITAVLTSLVTALTGYNTAAPMAGAKISIFAGTVTQ